MEKVLLSAYASVIDGERAFYCSMPLTSGRRFVEWAAGHGLTSADVDSADPALSDDHYRSVIRPNRDHAQQVVRKLRERTRNIVIDPSALPSVPGWTQGDWRSFWADVIERFAHAVYFVDDWAYSNGCAYEFYVAHRLGRSTFDERYQPITLSAGLEKIREATADLCQQGQTTDFLEEVIGLLEALQPTPAAA